MAGADQRHRDDRDITGRDGKPKPLPELGSELVPELVTQLARWRYFGDGPDNRFG